MARYSLILKDETFVTLFERASKQGKTFGKWLNEHLNQIAGTKSQSQGDVDACFFCGNKATFIGTGKNGLQISLCKIHFRIVERHTGKFTHRQL